MPQRLLLWLARLAGIGLLSVVHLALLMSITVAGLGGLLSRGPAGEELGSVYRDSEAGRRNAIAGEVLSWPTIRPVAMIESRLSGGTIRSLPWRVVRSAAFYANSLVWGIVLWALLEVLARGAYRALATSRQRQPDPSTPASDDARPLP